MNLETPTRMRPTGAIVFALVTVLALLVAPVCAPLCAARGCASSARVESCHDMAGAAADGGALITAGKACRNVELSAVLVSSDERALVSGTARVGTAPAALAYVVVRGADNFGDGTARSWMQRVPLEASGSPVLSKILRI